MKGVKSCLVSFGFESFFVEIVLDLENYVFVLIPFWRTYTDSTLCNS